MSQRFYEARSDDFSVDSNATFVVDGEWFFVAGSYSTVHVAENRGGMAGFRGVLDWAFAMDRRFVEEKGFPAVRS
ncbi:MAG: hypothetical protein LC131_02630 [Anaerolineae bacterium]|nr:hypothetical protein [Anaerolineae bacterium]